MRPRTFGLLMLLICACGNAGPSDWPVETFSASQWAATSEGQRYVFARDIVSKQRLQGKTAAEVKALIGTPSHESARDHYITYVVKKGGADFNQVYVLEVRFDPTSGRVEKTLIRGD